MGVVGMGVVGMGVVESRTMSSSKVTTVAEKRCASVQKHTEALFLSRWGDGGGGVRWLPSLLEKDETLLQHVAIYLQDLLSKHTWFSVSGIHSHCHIVLISACARMNTM